MSFKIKTRTNESADSVFADRKKDAIGLEKLSLSSYS